MARKVSFLLTFAAVCGIISVEKGEMRVRSKQNPFWVILCALVCVAVGVTLLACLPSWNGMGDMSALQAILYTVKQWLGL